METMRESMSVQRARLEALIDSAAKSQHAERGVTEGVEASIYNKMKALGDELRKGVKLHLEGAAKSYEEAKAGLEADLSLVSSEGQSLTRELLKPLREDMLRFLLLNSLKLKCIVSE